MQEYHSLTLTMPALGSARPISRTPNTEQSWVPVSLTKNPVPSGGMLAAIWRKNRDFRDPLRTTLKSSRTVGSTSEERKPSPRAGPFDSQKLSTPKNSEGYCQVWPAQPGATPPLQLGGDGSRTRASAVSDGPSEQCSLRHRATDHPARLEFPHWRQQRCNCVQLASSGPCRSVRPPPRQARPSRYQQSRAFFQHPSVSSAALSCLPASLPQARWLAWHQRAPVARGSKVGLSGHGITQSYHSGSQQAAVPLRLARVPTAKGHGLHSHPRCASPRPGGSPRQLGSGSGHKCVQRLQRRGPG